MLFGGFVSLGSAQYVEVLAIQILPIQFICVFDTDTDSKKCLDPVSIDTVSRYSTALYEPNQICQSRINYDKAV